MLSRASAQPEPPLTLLPDERVLWTGHSTCGDGATCSALVVLFGTVMWIGRWAFGQQLASGAPSRDWAFPGVFGLSTLVCVIVMVLIRPFRRAGYAITTHRAIFVHRNGVIGRYFHGIESHVRLDSPADVRYKAHRQDRGTILFRNSGKDGVDLAFARITDAQRVHELLQAVQRSWTTGQPQQVELPDSACIRCGYSLVGNVSGRCPECGQAVLAPPPAADGLVTIAGPDLQAETECATDEGKSA